MQSGAVDDHAGLVVVAHLLESERAADHVAGKALPAFGVVGFAADPVVHREAGVTPLEHAFSESGIQHAFRTQEIQYLVSQRLTKRRFRQRRQHPEGAGGQEHAVGNQGVNVRIESHEIAEGLHVQDKGGLAVRRHHLEAGLEECGYQAAEFAEVSATMAKERPN